MRARPPRRSSDAFSRWLAAAAVFHALALLGVGHWGSRLTAFALPAPPVAPPIEFAWGEESAAAFEPAAAEAQSPPAAPATEPAGALARATGAAARATPSAAVSETALANAELSSRAVADEAGDGGGDEAESAELAGAPAPAAAPGSRPRLSLDALGVGPRNNPFLGPPSAAATRAQLAARVDNVLHNGLAQHDQRLGLGPEGPAVAAVEALVMQSTTAPNSSAKLLLRTDATGETVLVEVIDASRDAAAWHGVAQDLLRELRGKKLRIPSGTGGVSMQLEVVSRNALPSGADPGLAIDLFGAEVKSGDGDRSTRLQLLTPKLEVSAP
jgi:hypothetical protein